MCDGKTFYDWQGAGLHQMFKTESVEVQCLNEKRGAVSIIDHCRIRVRRDSCDLIIQTPSGNSTQMIINGDLVRDPTRYTVDPRFQTTITKRPDLIRVEITADGGRITLDFAPYSFAVVAHKISRCAGMCGDCTGPQKRPTNMTQFVEPYTTMDAITGGNLCGANGADNATSSTSSPSNGSQSATTAKPGNGTITPLMTVAPAQIPDEKVVPAHPVFETESVMKQVYQQCLAGQEPSRMNEDAMFAAFVECCIYDKSLGPGAEHAALSTMQSFVTAANHSRALDLTDWRNTTMRSAAPIKLDSILTRTVTKRPDEIAPNSGVTYELRHLYVDVTRPKSDYLLTRSSRWSSQSMQMGLPYESSFSTIASVDNSNNMSGVIAQKLRLHFDIEAPVVVIQPPSPNVRLEAKATPIASEADAMPAPRRHRIPIDDDKDEDQPTTRPSPSPSRITKPAPATTSSPMPTTTMPITPAPTAAPTPAPTTRAPVKQFQIATIVRQREVPASEIREAPPAPEIPLQVLKQIAQPAVQTLVARPAAVQPAPAPVAAAPASIPVVPMAAVPVQPVAAMAAQPVAAIPAQPMAAMPAQPMAAMPAQAAMMAPGAQQAQVRPQQQQQQMRPANNQRAGILIPQQQMMVQHPVTVSGTPMMVGFGGRQGQMMGAGQMGTGQMVGAGQMGTGQMVGGQMMGAGQGRGWGMRGVPASASASGQGAQPGLTAGTQQGAAAGQASAAQAANGQAVNGQAGNGQVVNGQAGTAQPVNGQAGAGQAADGQSVLGQAVNGQAAQAGSEAGAGNRGHSKEEEERSGRGRRPVGMESGGSAPPDAAALGAITGQDGSAAGGDRVSGSDLGSPAPGVNAN